MRALKCPTRVLLIHVEGDLFDEAGQQALERRGVSAESRRSKSESGNEIKDGAFLSDFRDLKVGDFVGTCRPRIGRFGGLDPRSGPTQRRVHAALLR